MMSNKKEKLARAGMVAKGAVYAIIGTLTAMAAFNLGGTKSGKDNALQFLAGQPFGQVLLGALAIGYLATPSTVFMRRSMGRGSPGVKPKVL